MDYPYENLGPERFQEFVQALLAAEYPDVQCYPVGQADGGRDAVRYLTQHPRKGSPQFLMYQIKFVRDPSKKVRPSRWLREQATSEAPKVRAQLDKGVTRYVLITNLRGSGSRSVGTMDEADDLLRGILPVPARVWWRADLNRRLDSKWSLKWAYPELFTGTDFVRLLFEKELTKQGRRPQGAIRAYLQEQYDRDQEIRFKQVDLQNRLLDLFVDVPVSVPHGPIRQDNTNLTFQGLHALVARDVFGGHGRKSGEDPSTVVATDPTRQGFSLDVDSRRHLGAALWLLHPLVQQLVPCLVLEGAPGQGKSTVVQYVCQVHRARLLSLEQGGTLDILKKHAETPLRLPLKVDLRDFSAWVAGQDPFSAGAHTEEQGHRGPRSLEAFLAAQIHEYSGGLSFSVDDLLAVLGVSAALLVLDGLDEVADIERRKRVVREIEKGVSRLRANSASLQVVVTSRPAAFANSPGLPLEDFPYHQLGALNKTIASDYADKWLIARGVRDREKFEFKRVLSDKLDEPHLRDLSKNPMQLTILLSLIHTRGVSLPDKRTALYDSYIELFFNREAEKSKVVRDHRDLLIDIHRFLAWSLHAEAELGKHRGRISKDRLLALVGGYLEREGHRVDLIDELFAGMVERVVAIVSRAEGTFEFEVQPLREYFAARFLYETAPYSPTGAERAGTKPDRFDALARNYYWLNVARFYGGCYSKGELASLIDGIRELLEDEEFRLTGHPRTLAVGLLGDYVFMQHPKSVARLLRMILEGAGLRLLLCRSAPWDHGNESLILPDQCGRGALVDQCFRLLETAPPADYSREAIHVIGRNLTREQATKRWWSALSASKESDQPRWIEYGRDLGVLHKVDIGELVRCVQGVQESSRTDLRLALLRGERFDYFESDEGEFEVAIGLYLSGRAEPAFLMEGRTLLSRFAGSLWPVRYATALRRGGPVSVREGWARQFGWSGLDETQRLKGEEPRFAAAVKCADWLRVVDGCVELTESEWATSLRPWDEVVEKGRELWGERWAWLGVAMFAAGIRSKSEMCTESRELFDAASPLCQRARYARLRAGSRKWWRRSLRSAEGSLEMGLALGVLVAWGSVDTILACLEEIDELASSLTIKELVSLVENLDLVVGFLRRKGYRKEKIGGEELLKLGSNALALLSPRRGTGWHRHARRIVEESSAEGIVQRGVEISLQNLFDGKSNWQDYLVTLELAYQKNVSVVPYAPTAFRGYSKLLEMPLESARKILNSAERYPSLLIVAAEQVYRQSVGKRLFPVETVSAHEGWFRQ